MTNNSDKMITSGRCGENLEWVLTGEEDNYTLTVSGTGKMKDYKWKDKTPWKNYSSSIKTIEINSGVTSIGECAFSGCSGLTSVIIPDSVKSIRKNTFCNCIGLTSVLIPHSVTSIGDRTFLNCRSLTSVYIYSKIPVDISLNTFASIDKNKCTLYVPKGTVSAYRAATGWSSFEHIEEIPVTEKQQKYDK
jgi:hypothetical protein